MAMNGNGMGDEVLAKIKTIVDNGLDRDGSHEVIWRAICVAIVDHIKTNAEVENTPDDGGAHTHTPATVK